MEPVNKKIKVGSNAATSGDDDNVPESFLAPIAVITIPTKTYDGGTPRTSPNSQENRRDEGLHQNPNCKDKDPFLYYSNEANRLSYLLGQPHGDGGQLEPPTKRKTRLSFEVHPDLLLYEDSIMLSNVAARLLAQRAR